MREVSLIFMRAEVAVWLRLELGKFLSELLSNGSDGFLEAGHELLTVLRTLGCEGIGNRGSELGKNLKDSSTVPFGSGRLEFGQNSLGLLGLGEAVRELGILEGVPELVEKLVTGEDVIGTLAKLHVTVGLGSLVEEVRELR